MLSSKGFIGAVSMTSEITKGFKLISNDDHSIKEQLTTEVESKTEHYRIRNSGSKNKSNQYIQKTYMVPILFKS